MSSEGREQRQSEIISRSNINKNKIARIKLKPFEKINIYNVFMIKILTDMSDKLYLYVDDRTSDAQTIQKMVDDTFNVLRKFNVKLPDVVIRYTDYYETAWVYLHRLVTMRKTLLNYNSSQRSDDLQVLLRTNKIKIFLMQDPTDTESKTRYDNILYDNGWFRDIFLETIIDDAEKIDYMIDDNVGHNGSKIVRTNPGSVSGDQSSGTNKIEPTSMTGDFVKINRNLAQRLCEILKFNRPACVLTHVTDNVEILRSYKQKVSATTVRDADTSITIPTLNDLTLDQIGDMGIGMKHIRDMIENHDVSLQKYMIQFDAASQAVTTNTSPDVISHWLIDPIKIDLDEVRTVDIEGIQTQIGTLYMDSTEFATFEKDAGLKNNNAVSFKIRFAGSITVNRENEQYVCRWSHADKKKKKTQKQLLKWIPCNDTSEQQSIVYNFSYPESPDIHRLVFRSSKTTDKQSYLLFKINSTYYTRSSKDPQLLEILKL